MNKEIKAKWLEALRSGRYQQTRRALRRDNDQSFERPAGYCCLGVLSDVIDPKGWELAPEDSSPVSYRGANYSLHPDIKNYVRLDDVEQGCLIQMNDDQRKSFTEIADWIEVNL